MKKLYKFHWDCGRQGDVTGIFVAEEKEIRDNIGAEIDFGEILGKHSEIYGELNEEDLIVLTDDPEFIEKFEKLKCSSGYNPLQYIRVINDN